MNQIQNVTAPYANAPAGISITYDGNTITDDRKQQPSEGFGRRVAAARKELHLTPAKLAKQVGMTTGEVKDIETDGAWCTIEQARAFAGALQVDMLWLWLGRVRNLAASDTAAPGLQSLADQIVAGQQQLAAMDADDATADYDSGPNAAILTGWWDLVGTVLDQPVNSAVDVVALARICRALWAQTPGDECELRDALDQKLQRAVLAQASVPSADAELIGHCGRMISALKEANKIGNAPVLASDADTRIKRQVQVAENIEPLITAMRATTPEGIVALAQATAMMADGLIISNESDELLIMLLRDSLALGTVQPLPPIGPSPEITSAIAAVMAGRALCDHVDATTPADEDACDASADVHGRALDACGSVRISTMADAKAMAALVLDYCCHDEITGQADIATRGLLESLARYVPDTSSAGFATGGPSPDAELINLHNRFISLAGRIRRQFAFIRDDEKRAILREPLEKEQDEIIRKVWEMKATTLEGHRARARMLVSWDGEIKRGAMERCGADSEMLWMLVRDLLGEDHVDALQSDDLPTYTAAIDVARIGVEAPSPDTDIIAACQKVEAAWCEYERLDAENDALPEAERRAHELDVVNPAYNAASDLYDEVVGAPVPQTAEGLRAFARAAIFQASDNCVAGPHSVEMNGKGDELAWKLIGHLAGLEVKPVQVAA